MSERQIVWRGIYRPGHEHARVEGSREGWSIEGVSVFVHDSRPCRLDYAIACDPGWRTQRVDVRGWIGDERIGVEILVSSDGRWQLGGAECEAVRGCVDVDLNFSPVTTLLPIRRCGPRVGEAVDVTAAWLRFPSFALEPLEQTYTRRDERAYTYSSGGGAFTAELRVDDFGFVVDYPGGWVRE
jgi:hypothetical protein